MAPANGYERPAIAGSGTIASGLAACASALGDVLILARSSESALKATELAAKASAKVEGGDAGRITTTTDVGALADRDVVVEAITEDVDAKAELLGRIGAATGADLATTTSSLSIAAIGERAELADRLYGLHVFNPVPQMELVELCVPPAVRGGTRERAEAWCAALSKTAVNVPDEAGFVVNRLLFPYLFDAVRMLERTGLGAAEVDDCMRLGAGHRMGPLALLDYVGLDVAAAIGEALHADSGESLHRPPERLTSMVADGRLGKKSGRGFFEY